MGSKAGLVLGASLVILATIIFLLFNGKEAPKTMPEQSNNTSSGLKLTSQVFREGGQIPIQYTCKGQNVSPPLNITGVSQDAKSLALIVHDPDAVSGDFVHWLVWDMPTSTQNITANGVPSGAVQGQNGSGRNQYMGPCPPAGTGTHRYMFELYVLDTALGLPAGSNRTELEKAMQGHVLAQHTLIGLFIAD